jgi:hypothetical protein
MASSWHAHYCTFSPSVEKVVPPPITVVEVEDGHSASVDDAAHLLEVGRATNDYLYREPIALMARMSPTKPSMAITTDGGVWLNFSASFIGPSPRGASDVRMGRVDAASDKGERR